MPKGKNEKEHIHFTMFTYSQISSTTLINADTKDILMNISLHVKVCYLTVLSDLKLKDCLW